MYHYQILSPGKSFSPPSDGGAVGVPHAPEGAQQRDLLGPGGGARSGHGQQVLTHAAVLQLGCLGRARVLVQDGEAGHAAAPPRGQRVHQPCHHRRVSRVTCPHPRASLGI